MSLPIETPPTEPWLRGALPGFDPVVAHLLRASEQVREDMERAIASLDTSQLWSPPAGITPAGFHAKHLAGSTDRLCSYLAGEQLSAEQLARLSAESATGVTTGDTAKELLQAIAVALARYEGLLRELRPEQFHAFREVGRRRLKVTAIGLAIHIAEHAQRHTGQAITAAQAAIR
jgi:hypothetical protein